ncbi:unnamed protein product [Cyprideis torosa]|uniref:Glucosylceramidase n=1 Tax=Cyprideis torosa TaxID=163714 RepID=A0A7R8WCC1_9CRUS|nr:unnamed protein product [Cyprideis torosa]CAG0891861.1 unnamed protein product [Cyprideis torosa]
MAGNWFCPAVGCERRWYEHSSFVCVCDDSRCDQIGDVAVPELGGYLAVTSSKAEFRFHQETGRFTDQPNGLRNVYRLQKNVTYQSILGFGGAFTDAAGMGVTSLGEQAQEHLLRSYFSSEGIEYNIGRVPIAGCDFSTRPYSYCDTPGDVNLTTFSLAEEDSLFKIPLIQRSLTLNPDLWLFASPWAPPPWMKSNGEFNGAGFLLPQFWQPWAEYFIKYKKQKPGDFLHSVEARKSVFVSRFLAAYEAVGLRMWGLTAQNEPSAGNIPFYEWNCLGWNATTQRDWIRDHLGPTLAREGFGEIKLMIVDDNRLQLPAFPETVLSDPEAAQYISGIGVHWYSDWLIPPEVLSRTHDLLPQYFLLYTEACEGAGLLQADVELGSWERAETYAMNIIQDLLHWVTGWVDWNLALDTEGGPNWANNFVDSPIIVNATAGEFYKQPMFYAMGHFSKFLPRGSVHIGLEGLDVSDDLDVVAFNTPDGNVVLELLNRFKAGSEDGFGGRSLALALSQVPEVVQTEEWAPAASSVELLRKMDQGMSQHQLAKLFGVSQATVSGMKRNRSKLLAAYESNANPTRKRQRQGQQPKLEEELFKWISETRATTSTLIIEKAKAIAAAFAAETGDEVTCNFSEGWLRGFKNRYNISARIKTDWDFDD